MKLIFTFILLNIISNDLNAQIGCIDSSYFSKYNSVNYRGPLFGITQFTKDRANNYYVPGSSNFGFNRSGNTISKFNDANNLIWSKTYIPNTFTNEIGPTYQSGTDSLCNLYFQDTRVNNITGVAYNFLSKFDSSGNFIWGKRFQMLNNPTVYNTMVCNRTINEIGFQFYKFTSFNQTFRNNLICLNPNGDNVWSNQYNNITLPDFNLLGGNNTFCLENDTLLVNATRFFYNASSSTNPNAKHAIQFSKINSKNGDILYEKTFSFFTNQTQSVYHTIQPLIFNYDKVNKQFILFSISNNTTSLYPKSFVISTFDQNLKHIKSVNYLSSVIVGGNNFQVSSNNQISIAINKQLPIFPYPNYSLYVILDSVGEIIHQRRNDLYNIGIQAGGEILFDVNFKKSKIYSLLAAQYAANGCTDCSIYFLENIPFYNKKNDCIGYDNNILFKTPIYFQELININFVKLPGVLLSSIDLNAPSEIINQPLLKTEYCKEVSICDAIQLQPLTQPQKCLSQPLDSFKVIRSPLCLRKTQWQVDTTAMQILNSNDTMLYVKYLHSYTGNIAVTYGGCNLSSSTPITVNTPKTGVFIGNDTTLCPNTAITLNAGQGFKTYAWSTGFGIPSITITQAGKYWVTVIDSCNNQFTDTINISPITATLQVTSTDTICQYDTAFIQLPTNLYNYSWQPSTFSYLKANNVLSLYPKTNTIYTIKANAAKDCILTDTVLIRTKSCPQNIYFPTAFTPNGDGLNDEYKPSLIGNVVYYEFTIFNRWGQKIFSTKTPNKGWNGKINNGQPLMGSYVYTCRYKFFTKKEEVENGTFVLIR